MALENLSMGASKVPTVALETLIVPLEILTAAHNMLNMA